MSTATVKAQDWMRARPGKGSPVFMQSRMAAAALIGIDYGPQSRSGPAVSRMWGEVGKWIYPASDANCQFACRTTRRPKSGR